MLLVVRAGVIALVVAGCAGPQRSYRKEIDQVLATPQSGAQIPAPAAYEPKPWKVGQWARYKRRQGTRDSYDELGVVAQDACGYWIEWQHVEDTFSWRETFCVHSQPAPEWNADDELRFMIAQSDAGPPEVIDFRDGQHADKKRELAAVIENLARWGIVGDVRDDVVVPAGHFAQAAKVANGNTTVWRHPDVPLAGVVRATGPDMDLELVEYSEMGAPAMLPWLASELAQLRRYRRPRWSGVLGFGGGAITGHAADATTQVLAFSVGIAARLTTQLDLTDEVIFPVSSSAGRSPIGGHLLLLGARWSPFRNHTDDGLEPPASGFYLRAGVGEGEIDRAAGNVQGFAAQAAAGWRTLTPRDYDGGIEIGDQVAWYGGDVGTRHLLSIRLYFELYSNLPFLH